MAVDAKILVILGPTASGKSDLAMALARLHGADILSVDSMQVYRQMDIGTAKPSQAEQAQVRHHLIDVVEPDESFTVARFVEQADEIIRNCRQAGRPLVATGGTPLYHKALFEGLFDGPEADATLRATLSALGNQKLHRQLVERDPSAAARIHLNDTRRLVRALEVIEITGRPISQQQTQWESKAARHPSVWVGLLWNRDDLNRRINARAKAMVAAGWVDEVKGMLERYPVLSKTAAEATGYQDLIEHVRGRLSLEDAIERVKIATRQLARKQMKWLKRFPNVTWLEGAAPLQENVERACKIWSDANRAD